MRITTKEAAEVMGCTEQFIRIGLQRDRLHFGDAVMMSRKRWTYYIDSVRLAKHLQRDVDEVEAEILERRKEH